MKKTLIGIIAAALALSNCEEKQPDPKTGLTYDVISRVTVPGKQILAEKYDTELASGLAEATPDMEGIGIIYLLDFSGSMDEKIKNKKGEKVRKVDVLENYPFPLGSQVYIFGDAQGNYEDKPIADISANGGTPMLSGIYQLLSDKSINPTQVITLTDGDNNSELIGLEETIAAANTRAIKLSFVGVGISNRHQDYLKDIASKTNGTYVNVSQ